MNHLSFAQSQRSLSRRRFLSYGAVAATGLTLPAVGLAAKHSHSELQHQLNWLLKRQRREGRISPYERTAWSVYDLQTNQKLVSIAENIPLQAASMVKVYVALAYFYLHRQAPRKYPYHERERRLMERMLVRSSNWATNKIIEMCKGPANVQKLCQVATKHRFQSLRVVEYIPSGGKTYRNKASADDYHRFLYDLWHNRLPCSGEIKRIMAIRNRDRISSEAMPDYVRVYDKTGSTGYLCGNMGVVQLNSGCAYTFISIIQRHNKAGSYKRWIRTRGDAMREASALVYRFMNSRYELLEDLS
ncbi:MAG: serine hydrolase [Gammaproteobacteria bacterium]|nr:MAG: serine hydrolase [Gammaproteobacteria bacterium]